MTFNHHFVVDCIDFIFTNFTSFYCWATAEHIENKIKDEKSEESLIKD